MRAWLALLALVGCQAASPAVDPSQQAAAEMADAVEDAEAKLDDYLPLYSQRQRSSWQAEWDIIGLGESRTRTVLSTGWGVSMTPWMPEGAPGMRFLTFSQMLHTGDYGDTQYDAFHIQFGHDPHFAVYETTAVEVQLGSRFRYTLTGAGQHEFSGPDVLVDTSRPYELRSSFSFGGTLGARLAEGAITVELFGEAAYAIDEPYLGPVDDPSDVTRWKPRGGVTVKTDLCFQLGYNDQRCYYDATAQENVDLGSVLRRALRRVEPPPEPPPGEEWAGDEWRTRPLCRAAAKGVVLAKLGPSDHCQGFEAEGFFCRTANALADERLRARIEDIHRVHNELEACTTLQRRHSVGARANERSLKIRLQYGAYAPELRAALGCDPAAFTPKEEAASLKNETVKDNYKQERRTERANARRACELCPRACPPGAWWLGD
jgi:hypothetical protein